MLALRTPFAQCVRGRKVFAVLDECSRVCVLARATQYRAFMAAVFALVFLFALASTGLLVKVITGDTSWTSGFALVTFMALTWGVFVGLFKMARTWERDAGPEH